MYGVVAALGGRWLLVLLAYVIAVASALHIVADLDPEGGYSLVASNVAEDVLVLPKPRTGIVRMASTGLAMKAGLVLTLSAAAGATTGNLPHTVQNWVADAVLRTVGLDIPGGRPVDEQRGPTDSRVVQGLPEKGPVGPEPAPVPGAPGGSPTVTSQADGGAPSGGQTGPLDATSPNGPSEGENRPSPPSGAQPEPDRARGPNGPSEGENRPSPRSRVKQEPDWKVEGPTGPPAPGHSGPAAGRPTRAPGGQRAAAPGQ